MACPGSVAANEAEPDKPSEWAAEGTVAHFVFYLCLRFHMEAADFHGREFNRDGFKIVVNDEMVDHIQELVDEVHDFGGDQYYETRVKLDRWMPDQFGTLDVGIIAEKRGIIVIRDLKYGSGVPVSPIRNEQLMIYGLGFWDQIAKYKWRDEYLPNFRFIIDQPRITAGGGSWTCSFDDLMAFGKEVRAAAAKTYDKNAKRIPGDKQCQYCRAAMNGHCREYDSFQMAKFGAKFSDFESKKKFELPDPEKIPAKVRAKIITGAPGLKSWLNRLHADHLNDCLAGFDGGGLKAVQGRRGRRSWVDENDAEAFLLNVANVKPESAHVRKLISPAIAEKLIPAKLKPKLKDFYQQPDGKPSLVPVEDDRPALKTYKERFTESFDD